MRTQKQKIHFSEYRVRKDQLLVLRVKREKKREKKEKRIEECE